MNELQMDRLATLEYGIIVCQSQRSRAVIFDKSIKNELIMTNPTTMKTATFRLLTVTALEHDNIVVSMLLLSSNFNIKSTVVGNHGGAISRSQIFQLKICYKTNPAVGYVQRTASKHFPLEKGTRIHQYVEKYDN